MAENKRGKAATGQENLRPVKTKEEARERGRNGGKASGEVRRARKTLREELLLLLANGDTQKSVTVAMIEKALSGDVRAFEVIRDTIGEKPTDKQETDLTLNGVIKVELTDDADD